MNAPMKPTLRNTLNHMVSGLRHGPATGLAFAKNDAAQVAHQLRSIPSLLHPDLRATDAKAILGPHWEASLQFGIRQSHYTLTRQNEGVRAEVMASFTSTDSIIAGVGLRREPYTAQLWMQLTADGEPRTHGFLLRMPVDAAQELIPLNDLQRASLERAPDPGDVLCRSLLQLIEASEQPLCSRPSLGSEARIAAVQVEGGRYMYQPFAPTHIGSTGAREAIPFNAGLHKTSGRLNWPAEVYYQPPVPYFGGSVALWVSHVSGAQHASEHPTMALTPQLRSLWDTICDRMGNGVQQLLHAAA